MNENNDTKKHKRKRKNEALYELQDLEVVKVDLVGEPATGDKFLVVRSDDSEKVKENVKPKTPEIIEENKKQNNISELLKNVEGISLKAANIFRDVKNFSFDNNDKKVLSSENLEALYELGRSVSYVIATAGIDNASSNDLIWQSLQRAGAKMATTRLEKFRNALRSLSGILDELEYKMEKETMKKEEVKRESVTQITENEGTDVKPENVAPVESKSVKAEPVKVEPVKAEPVKAEPISDEPKIASIARMETSLQDLISKLEEIQRSHVESVDNYKKMVDQIDGINNRITQIEQASTGTNQQPEENTQTVQRDKTKGFWGNITGMAP